ncbi:MAG: T9SS type A sorting domain-containing protein [Calditrichaeota bacterium]|nr:T9SS type A sorting domain-containing protein [Calditrichota bacterium]
MKLCLSLCSVLTILGFAARTFAMVPVDDFTAGAVELSGSSGSDLTMDAGILGGERLTQFTLTAGSSYNPALGQAANAEYQSMTGWMFYSSSFGNLASWSLTYGATADLDFDATACLADRFILGACCQLDVDADGGSSGVWGVDGTPMSLTLWSNGTNVTVSRVLYGNSVVSQGPINFEFLFSEFPGIDFSSIDRIRFQFEQTTQNPAVDYGFHGIYMNCEQSGDATTGDVPSAFNLENAWPNPFNPSTTLSFTLEETGIVSLTVHNMVGHTVATLVDGLVGAGRHDLVFDAAGLPSGVYFYTLQAGQHALTRKMVLMK